MVYIDDVIIHGKIPEEFLVILRIIFTRFREFKNKFHLNTVEFIQSLINKDDMHYTKFCFK